MDARLLLAESMVTPQIRGMILLASGIAALAVARLAWVVVATATRREPTPDEIPSWEFDNRRRARLRAASRTYRWFGPFIDELVPLRVLHCACGVERVRRHLNAGAESAPWTAEEYIALVTFQGVLAGAAAAWLGTRALGPLIGAGLGVGTFVWFLVSGVRKLGFKARVRLGRFKQRLPFGVDLIALMMEAGAGFRESLATVARECGDHPLGQELTTIQQDLARGQTLHETLTQLHQRLRDDDVRELVFAITKAEELGTPLSRVFLNLADQMRLKRAQWAEKAAGAAQTMITFPGMVVMVACLIAVAAPFMLSALANYK